MATKGYRNFIRMLEHWANHGVPQMLGTIVSVVAVALGLSMLLNPAAHLAADHFENVFTFASPAAWGTLYITAALAVLIMVYTNPKTAQAPVIALALVYVGQGILTIPQATAGGLPSDIFLCIGMAWVCLATQLVCGVAKERVYEKATFDH